MENKSSNSEEKVLIAAKKMSLNVFSCENLRVDSSKNRIVLNDIEKILQPKVMQLLLLLCAADGKTLSKDQLNQMLWPDTHVGPDSLANIMTRLRKALSDSSKQPYYIETVQRKGYRWLLPVAQNESFSIGNNVIKYYVFAAAALLLISVSFWGIRSHPEKFPFTDLSIETTEKGMEIKVGVEAEMNAENQEKIKQEISRITGKSTDQMQISIDRDCTALEIKNKQTNNCSLPIKKETADKLSL